jgi:WD40 repeat protein
LFFGREEQTAALLQLLRQNRFLAVVGTSGSGKSSLVRAGLIAELYGGTMTRAGSTWEVVLVRPGGSPIENLARAIVEADLYDPNTLPRLLATLNRSRFGLVEAVKQCEDFDPDANLLVVVDQFEELFRFRQQGVDSEEAAAAFVNLLLAASDQAECPIYVTITMRSDYLGDCSEIPGLAEVVNAGEYLIPRLLRDQKRDAIEKPIGVGGARISPLLVQRLLNDVGDDSDQLPVLQHALMRMWEVWSAADDRDRPIDFGDFEAIGGLAAALSNHADEVYDALPDDRHRMACERVFKTLTEKGADNRGIRRPTRLGRLEAIAGADRATVVAVLDAFRQGGVTFLMPGMDQDLDDRTVVDLSHESLMRGWRRLRSWVEDESQSARIFRRLLDTSWLWGEGKAGLFRDPDLQIALSWREEEQPNADWAELYGGHFETAVAFLEKSRAEAEAEEQASEAVRQHELEQARLLAESRRERLVQQQRSARKLRRMIGVLAVVAAIAGVACIFALIANNRANNLAVLASSERDNAQHNAAEARREREAALQAQQTTEQALTAVEAEKRRAELNLNKAETAEKEAQHAEKRSREFRYATDVQLSARLLGDEHANAGQVLDRLADHDPEKNRDLKDKDDLRSFEWHYLKRLVDSRAAIFPGGDSPVIDSVLTPDGELITLDNDARVRRWDVKTRRERRPALELKQGHALAFKVLSPDGRRAALAYEDKVHLVDTSTGQEVIRPIPGRARFGLIFSPDCRMVVTVDARIGWWNAATGKPIAVQESKLAMAGPVTIAADGLTLAVGGQPSGFDAAAFSVFRMNPDAREVNVLLDKHVANMGSTRAVALSPDGKTLAVSQFFSGLVILFEASTGRRLGSRRFDHAASVSAIGFNAEGDTMATACLDGSIKVWADYRNVQSTGRASLATTTLIGHREEVTRIAIVSGGTPVISSSRDKTVRIWDLSQKTASLHRTVDGLLTDRVRFSPDGLLIAAAEQGGPRLRDAATGRLVRELRRPADADPNASRVFPDSVAFSPDNRWLAVGLGGMSAVSRVELWDIDSGERVAALPGTTDIPNLRTDANNGIVGALAFSPDGKFLVAGFGSLHSLPLRPMGAAPLKVYDVATRRTIRLLEGHENYCPSLAFSPDGSRMASASYDGTARIWDRATWKTAHVLSNPDMSTRSGLRRVLSVGFSPAGDLLAMASHEGSVHVWNAVSGELVQTLKGHANGVSSVAFSPDGRTLASGSYDHTVRLWNVATWRELMSLEPGGNFVPPALTFSPDGLQLLAAAYPAVLWSTRPDDEAQLHRAAGRLAGLLDSRSDFTTRIRMLSESPGLLEALEALERRRHDDARVKGA